MTTRESKSRDPTGGFPGDLAKAGVSPSKGGTKSGTVPLNWKGVYYTNCPLVLSAGKVDQELGWTREEFKKISVKYAFMRMRRVIILLAMLFGAVTPAVAQFSIGIGLPNVSIGINVPVYPEFEQVPGYPVYYAPQVDSNYFFYDGMYWVFQSDSWYASSWLQRAVGDGVPNGGADVHAPNPGALLPSSSHVLSRLAAGCAATLG